VLPVLEYKDIKKDKLTANFANCVDLKPLAAVLLLGNLFYLKERVTISQAQTINECIDAIAANVTPNQLNNLLKTALTVDKAHKDLMEKDSIAVLDAFVTYSIEDKALRSKINNNNLVLCASQPQHALRASITLIQNHLIAQKESNPLVTFDYGLLKNASHDQIKQHLSSIIKGCKSLPEADLIHIGEKSEAAARMICSIVYGHDKRCEIEAKFAEKHANMRPKLAKQWTKTASSVPQTTTKENNMKRKAEDLGEKYPEFKKVNEAKRTTRDAAPAKPQGEQNAVPTFTILGSMIGWMANPAAVPAAKACVFGAPAAGAAACLGPALLPIAGCALAGAALGLLTNNAEHNKESNQSNTTPKPKP
jgi:hypothetical protein